MVMLINSIHKLLFPMDCRNVTEAGLTNADEANGTFAKSLMPEMMPSIFMSGDAGDHKGDARRHEEKQRRKAVSTF